MATNRIVYQEKRCAGNRRSWARIIEAIDRAQSGVNALIGEYLPAGKQIELPSGSLVVEVRPAGSKTNEKWTWEASLFRVRGNDLQSISETYEWDDEFDLLLHRAEQELADPVPPMISLTLSSEHRRILHEASKHLPPDCSVEEFALSSLISAAVQLIPPFRRNELISTLKAMAGDKAKRDLV